MAKRRKLTPYQQLVMQVSIATTAGYFEQPRIKKKLIKLSKKRRRKTKWDFSRK